MNIRGRKVIVQDGNVDKALRKFKKKISEDGLLQELQERQFYTKPTVKKKLAKSQAKRRWQKHLNSQQLPKKLF
jgi:small subunit ribosomal protein S21